MPNPNSDPKKVPMPAAMRGFGIICTTIFAALLVAMFWPSQPPKIEKNTALPARSADAIEKIEWPTAPNHKPSSANIPEMDLAQEAEREAMEEKLTELPLTRRLEDYYLTDVLLENVQLGQAMSILRTKLQETDSEHALALHKLAVTTPATAMGRRVTLFSQSIPYLTAVQNVATQAGCTVEVTENRITLKVQPGPYPQTASKRAMKDLLSGLSDDQGRPLSESKEALDRLGTLASQLGIQFDAQGNASLTQNQWDSLRQLNAEQRRQASNALPTFALYILPAGFLSPNLNPDPVAVFTLLVNLQQQGYPPYSRLPQGMDPTVAYQILMLIRRGEAIVLTLFDIPATESVAEVDKEPASVTPSHSSASAVNISGANAMRIRLENPEGYSAPHGDVFHIFKAGASAYSVDFNTFDSSTSANVLNDLLTSGGVNISDQVVTPTAPPGDTAVIAVPIAPPAATE
jgi:hypothetical protein